VHSGGGVNTVVTAMSYDFGSVCTEVQVIAGLIDGVTLGAVALVEVVVEVLAGVGVEAFVPDEEVGSVG
jgi:hypothetical protein